MTKLTAAMRGPVTSSATGVRAELRLCAQYRRVKRNDNKPYSQEYNLKVAYKLDKNWAPYGELGNVGVNDRSDRQTRFRVGVAYSF